MRCHICDRSLGEGEVTYSEFHDEFDPCPICLQAISEVFSHQSEEEITAELEWEFPELSDDYDFIPVVIEDYS